MIASGSISNCLVITQKMERNSSGCFERRDLDKFLQGVTIQSVTCQTRRRRRVVAPRRYCQLCSVELKSYMIAKSHSLEENEKKWRIILYAIAVVRCFSLWGYIWKKKKLYTKIKLWSKFLFIKTELTRQDSNSVLDPLLACWKYTKLQRKKD